MLKNTKKRVLFGGLAVIVAGGIFLSGWSISFTGQAMAQGLAERVNNVKNPIARTLLAKFLPNPNMLAEDHVRLSCEPNFSVKVFTQTVLLNADFVVKEAVSDAVLYGPKTVDKIAPLWQTVPLGPMSYIPSKIVVTMDAKTADGKAVHDELILEPDCEKPIQVTNLTNKVTILWPKGKILFNQPPFDPREPTRPRLIEIPVTVLLPKEAVGKSLVTAVIWKDPLTSVKHYISADRLETIPVELVQLNLQSVSPITVQTREDGKTVYSSSFFDIFVEISVGEPAGSVLPGVIKEGALALPKVASDDRVIHPDGSQTFVASESTFAESFFDISPLRLIDAAPLEKDSAVTSGSAAESSGYTGLTSNPFPFEVR